VVNAAVTVEYNLLNLLGLGGYGDLLTDPFGLVGHGALNVFADGTDVYQCFAGGVVNYLSGDVHEGDFHGHARAQGSSGDLGTDAGAAAI